MPKVKRVSSSEPAKLSRPALTPEARENQMIARAVDLAERQLVDGTASSQVITHFLKLGTQKSQLELEKMKQENELIKAKTEQIHSAKNIEELYKNAIDAMRSYNGSIDVEVGEEND